MYVNKEEKRISHNRCRNDL